MAGIGFSLRRLRGHGGLSGLCKMYAAAGLISSGSWLISIVTIVLAGVLSKPLVPSPDLVPQFQVSVTYLFACSLVLCGPLQLLFTRFAADRAFEKRDDLVLPNLFGAMLLVSVIAGVLATAVMLLYFDGHSLLYRALMVESFVMLCNLWLVIVVLTSLQRHGTVLLSFAGAYAITLAGVLLGAPHGLEGLMAGFAAGQAFLLFAALCMVVRHYPGRSLMAFGFLRRDQVFPSLALTGLLFNLGVWIDKFLFWANPLTSEAVIGPLRSAYLYDVPVFLAYLSVVPGMAVFLVRMETDFAEAYTAFYDAVRDGASLERIEHLRDRMTVAARQGILEILKVQGLALVLLVVFAPDLLALAGISELFLPLLYIDAAAVGIQVLLLAVLNVFFYLDQRAMALKLCLSFAALNAVATMLTQRLGYVFYGYGFALAVLVATLLGMAHLHRTFDGLVRDTFMLQGGDR